MTCRFQDSYLHPLDELESLHRKPRPSIDQRWDSDLYGYDPETMYFVVVHLHSGRYHIISGGKHVLKVPPVRSLVPHAIRIDTKARII